MTDTAGAPRWTTEVAFTGGSWVADYPATNLRIFPFARVARSADLLAASTQFRGEFTTGRLLEMIVLCHHNLSINARWRVRLFFRRVDVQPVYDSGWMDALPIVYSESEVTWDSGNFWDRKYTDAERSGSPQDARLYIPGDLTVEAFTVEIDDTQNVAGFVQIGLCEVASALDFPIGFAFGSQLGFLTRTVVTEADGGVEYFEPRSKPRTFTGTLPALARSTSLSSFYELQRLNDLNVPFYWWPGRDDLKNASRQAFMARFQQLDPITQAYTAHDTLTISLKELL